MAERLQLVAARSGQPTVEVNGVAYHSPYDPAREAQKFYSSFRLEEADILLHFGWGLGYCGDILRSRAKPGARIIVFEPDEELFRLALAEPAYRIISKDARFRFVTGPEVSRFFDDWAGLGAFQETDQFLWLEWPAALREHGSIAELLKRQFKTHLRDRAANLLTHFQNGEKYFESVMRNFEYQQDADAARLFGRFRNIPLVIVSAGPSLDRNIHELRGIEDRCFVLSVDTALRPLLAAGITPHAVIIADPSELNASHVVDAVPEAVFLIAEQAVHASALQAASQRFLFGLGLFPDSLFAKFGFAKGRLEAWGSVATTALDLACRMGANPIIFTGQDFGYSWDRDYASNTIYHGNHFDIRESGKVRARNILGGETYTTENLIASRDFFVRRMRQAPGVRFINATEGGILTEGAEILALQDALRQCVVQPVEAQVALRNCYRSSKTSSDALHHLHEILTSRQTNCDCLKEFLELTAKQPLLNRSEPEIEKKILWGAKIVSELTGKMGT